MSRIGGIKQAICTDVGLNECKETSQESELYTSAKSNIVAVQGGIPVFCVWSGHSRWLFLALSYIPLPDQPASPTPYLQLAGLYVLVPGPN